MAELLYAKKSATVYLKKGRKMYKLTEPSKPAQQQKQQNNHKTNRNPLNIVCIFPWLVKTL